MAALASLPWARSSHGEGGACCVRPAWAVGAATALCAGRAGSARCPSPLTRHERAGRAGRMAERRSKYGNRVVQEAGQRYASVLERDVARVLDLLVQQGRVERYERQIAVELAPHRGRERSVVYTA